MAGSGRLKADPLYQGLARPPMIFGVSYLYGVLVFFFCLIVFIQTGNFLAVLVLLPFMYGIGYLICLKEPRAVELLFLKLQFGFRTLNRRFHGNTNSYDLF